MEQTSIPRKKSRFYVLCFSLLIIIISGIFPAIILSKSLRTGENMFIKRNNLKPVEFDGIKIIDYTSSQVDSSSFAEVTVPSGVHHKISWSNRSDKYYYVIEGNVNFTIGGEHDMLSSGDACIIPKGVRFSYSNDGPGDAKLILVHTPSFKMEFEEFEE